MFKPGQKIELERDFDPEVRAQAPSDNIILPDMDQTYTVRCMSYVTGIGDVLFLEEIVNTPRMYLDVLKRMEQGFDPSRFRIASPAPLQREVGSNG